jgi:hypothetical protein
MISPLRRTSQLKMTASTRVKRGSPPKHSNVAGPLAVEDLAPSEQDRPVISPASFENMRLQLEEGRTRELALNNAIGKLLAREGAFL